MVLVIQPAALVHYKITEAICVPVKRCETQALQKPFDRMVSSVENLAALVVAPRAANRRLECGPGASITFLENYTDALSVFLTTKLMFRKLFCSVCANHR
jgi:hypothetical protein